MNHTIRQNGTKPSQEIIDMVASHFRSAGYTVGINNPYSNSVCASMDPNKARTKTIMIEVNKAVYLQPDACETLYSGCLLTLLDAKKESNKSRYKTAPARAILTGDFFRSFGRSWTKKYENVVQMLPKLGLAEKENLPNRCSTTIWE